MKHVLFAATLLAAGLAVPAIVLSDQAAGQALAQAAPTLRVGAARVSITMPLAELPAAFNRIADDVYVRVLILENGDARIAMVLGDAPMMAADVSQSLRNSIAARLNVDPRNVMLGLTHTHNNLRLDRQPGGIILPGSAAFVDLFERATMAAVDEALAEMQPARMAVGDGQVELVGAKNIWSARLQRVIEGIDRTDRPEGLGQLGLIRFEDVHGRPIAFVLNYGINPVVAMQMAGAISGDVPGAAARYLEQRTGGETVALFTIAAAGNPLYRSAPDPIYGEADPQRLVQAMGTIIAEEAIAVSRATPARFDSPVLDGRQRSLQCPGKVTVPLNLPDRCAHEEGSSLPACTFVDTPRAPVSMALGVLQVGPVAMVHADANISLPVGARLARESALANSWTVSLNYGPMRYIVADADYPRNTYEATASIAQQGCAENAFIDNALGMMAETGALQRGN